MPRGGDRSAQTAAAGKKVGRPGKAALPKIRRDVAFEIVDVLNTPEKKRDDVLKKVSGEARFAYELMMASGPSLKWDIYRYTKECVDGKPLTRSEDKILFDPNQPLRVLVEHIGQPGSGSRHPVAAQAK